MKGVTLLKNSLLISLCGFLLADQLCMGYLMLKLYSFDCNNYVFSVSLRFLFVIWQVFLSNIDNLLIVVWF